MSQQKVQIQSLKKRPPQQDTPMLHLVIEHSKVLVYSNTVRTTQNMNDANRAYDTSAPSATAARFVYLLTGELQDFQRFARTENAKWLLDIAHDMCDPRRRRGTLWVWIDDKDGPVQATDPLLPKVYEYRVTEPVRLTKISRREGKSKSISAQESSASRMRTEVQHRDNGCWITRMPLPIVNSHICPKRLGNEQIQFIYRDFVDSNPPPGLKIYDACLGLSLFTALDTFFDACDFGFKRSSNNQYEVHDFTSYNITMLGSTVTSEIPVIPLLHGKRVSPPNPSSTQNPPPGLFAWHYLQCVIRKFGAPDYCGVPNIEHYVTSIPMEGDSDDDGTDDEADWLSAVFDRGRWTGEREAAERERMNTTAAWVHAQ